MPKKSRSIALVPAARMPARTEVQTHKDIPLAIRESITLFEQALGGRAGLVEALSSGDSDDSIQAILAIVGDPGNDTHPLAKLCAQAGISPGQLFGAFDRAAVVRANILGRLEATKAIPQTVKEVARTALPHEAVCAACNGLGSHSEVDAKGKVCQEPCLSCNGLGVLKREADPDQQQKLFEITGLLKSGGATVLQQTNVVTPSSVVGGSLEQLQQAVSDSIYRKPSSPVDAEVVPSRDEPPLR